MKNVVLPTVPLRGHTNMEGAMRAVFGPAVLRKVHGPSLRGAYESFDANGKRRFQFRVAVDQVPPPIRRFFCGSNLRITTQQTLDKEPAKWTVSNKMKLHFVGAEFFKLRPVFWLEQDQDTGVVSLGGNVRHDAVLPPPLNSIAEGFMALNTRRELIRFAQCLQEDGVLDNESIEGGMADALLPQTRPSQPSQPSQPNRPS